ncbi:MAG: DUF4180 domain-containing protein [Bacteroidales bacterium]|jgi:hypothetical protein|nr:DUF4180 domain-containing protein [Bacteroidales bacterium]
MLKYHLTSDKSTVAELVDETYKIKDARDALDLMVEACMNNCSSIIISEKNLEDSFFDLRNGLAGDILQKFSNYRVRLAITGDFSKYRSKSLQDFIRECNNRKMILFTDSVDAALRHLL